MRTVLTLDRSIMLYLVITQVTAGSDTVGQVVRFLARSGYDVTDIECPSGAATAILRNALQDRMVCYHLCTSKSGL